MILERDGSGVRLSTMDASLLVEIGWTGGIVLNGSTRAIDHVAQVLPGRVDVDRTVGALLRRGAALVEGPYVWPDDVCDAQVPPAMRKVMATVTVASGLLVLAAPLATGDQLDRHLATWGAEVPHHVALRVPDIRQAVREWSVAGYLVGPITDDGGLAQVFMASPTRQIVELISRRTVAQDTFTCANVAALCAAEDALKADGP